MTRNQPSMIFIVSVVLILGAEQGLIAQNSDQDRSSSYLKGVIATPPALGAPIDLGTCVTVDGDTDSSGLLTCVQNVLHRSGIKFYLSKKNGNDTQLETAFKNLALCSTDGSKKVSILGHGQAGYVHVGGGDAYINNPNLYVGFRPGWDSGPQPWNVKLWADDIIANDLAKKFDTTLLLGCEVGYQSLGSQLTIEVSKRMSGQIKAPTTDVYCDEANNQLRLLDGGGWVTAQSGKITEIKQSDKIMSSERSSFFYPLDETGTFKEIKFSWISRTTVCIFNTPAHPQDNPQKCQGLSPAGWKEFRLAAFSSLPFQPHAIPAAETSGNLEIEISPEIVDREHVPHLLEFAIVGDKMLAHRPTKTYYYFPEDFRAKWIELR